MSSRDRSGLREEIISAGLELGTQLGEEGLTMRGIAAKLGVSATALYQHFESKAQILREIRYYGLDRLGRKLAESMAVDDPLERLAKMALGYVEFARENPWLYMILMEHEQIEWADVSPEEVKALIAPMEAVRACLREAGSRRCVREDLDVDTASFQLWAAIHGVSALVIRGRISEHHPAIPIADERTFLEAFVRGMIAGFTGGSN